ncbi:hypothetical protein P3X46_006609 [Hevea brasiliensis]|uniref:Protein kinase domain-containing protein n=1 Tax=Hevea brasiliensis TaxID=3981 RepID=A0ABQ9MT31_HEVBR|nr:mitogen-activated protein kinase kinase kinase 18 [Hevea brasiliensis]KAJ9182637.1 hypothetical protein P3X46_006609 [Hevea brasiliensis]
MEWTRGPVVGRGSTATVSLATSASTGELFAVKSTELSRSMFLQKEHYFLSKLSSPYVVKYLGYDITDEDSKPMYNICMEYVAGGTLHDAIRRHGGQLDEPTIRLYTRDILQGLEYLHTNGLVHCDLKSKNVLISKEGAKIADFGCAKYVEKVGGCAMSEFSGTPAFMAPEVARGEEQGFPADLWALGCTVIEMATGTIPWTEQQNDPVSALYQIGFSGVVPEFPSWLTEKGQDFLSKCLRRDPKERWTAKELLDHPFLGNLDLELREMEDFTTTSPSCVLDQDFWDSMEALESPQGLTLEGFSNSPAERIKKLIECTFPAEVPNWTWAEDDWITVRNSDTEEILVDTPSVPTAFLTSDSIFYEQELERSIFYEDLLMEFFVENENISNNSNVSTNEGYDSVSENLNFETYNNKSCFLKSHIFLVVCFNYIFLANIFLDKPTALFLFFRLSQIQMPIPLFWIIGLT